MKSTQRFSAWLRPRFGLRLLFVAVTLACAVAAYVGSYVARSARGRYEPMVIGLNGVKWYDWAPEGFVGEGWKWNETQIWWYYPLWRLDRRFWHKSLDGSLVRKSDFPIDEIPPKEINKVYRAIDEQLHEATVNPQK
jgi:hypothetical protein